MNRAEATFDVQGDLTVTGGGVIFNDGILRKSAGSGILTTDGDFYSSGTIDVLAGTFSFRRATLGGTVTLQSGTTLRIVQDTVHVSEVVSGATVTGGTLEVRGGRLEVRGGATVAVDALIVLGNNTATIKPGAILEAGSLQATNGTLTIEGTADISSANLQENGRLNVQPGSVASFGDLIVGNNSRVDPIVPITLNTLAFQPGASLFGSADVTVTGLMTWTGGMLSGTGRVLALGGLEISGVADKVLAQRLENGGTGTWTAGRLVHQNGASFHNRTGATFEVQADLTSVYAPGPLSFIVDNAGVFRKSAGAGTLTVGTQFLNTGLVEVLSGTLAIRNVSTQTGTLFADAGGVINITGNLTQSAQGTVKVSLGGTAPSQFGRITVSGTATLDGTLTVQLVNGFQPALGNSFQVLTFASRTGTFATVNVPAIPGLAMSAVYGATDVRLNVTTPLVAAGPSVKVSVLQPSGVDVVQVTSALIQNDPRPIDDRPFQSLPLESMTEDANAKPVSQVDWSSVLEEPQEGVDAAVRAEWSWQPLQTEARDESWEHGLAVDTVALLDQLFAAEEWMTSV